jgi:hypothetical protein
MAAPANSAATVPYELRSNAGFSSCDANERAAAELGFMMMQRQVKIVNSRPSIPDISPVGLTCTGSQVSQSMAHAASAARSYM